MRLALLALVMAAAGVITPAAAGHSIVLPFSSRPADLQLYTVIVPTETDSPTREVAVKVPEGIDFLLVKETPGWKVDVQRANDRIDVIRWTGSTPPDQFASSASSHATRSSKASWRGGSRRHMRTARPSAGSARPEATIRPRSRGSASPQRPSTSPPGSTEAPVRPAGRRRRGRSPRRPRRPTRAGATTTLARIGVVAALVLSTLAIVGLVLTRRQKAVV